MDYDLTFIVQQSLAPIIPAILPLAEATGATMEECLAAFIVGAEVVSRFLRANYKVAFDGGWHAVGVVGVLGAAAASARLLQVPSDRIPAVMSISASLASGLTANFGTMVKPLHAGHAARSGVLAAQLGKSGFTAGQSAFEARGGYFFAFGRGLEVTLDPFKDFGSRYDLVSMFFKIKAYPCGGLTHAPIEAALAQRETLKGRHADIKNIHCFLSRNAAQRVSTEYPITVEAAKFSIAYLVPYALVHGVPKISAFTEVALHDDRLKGLAKTVTASVDPDLGMGIDDSPARLRITLNDGQTYEERIDHTMGSAGKPFTQAGLEEKFYDCAAQAVTPAVANKALAILNRLPGDGVLTELWPLLRKG